MVNPAPSNPSEFAPDAPRSIVDAVPSQGAAILWDAVLDDDAGHALGHFPYLGGVLHGALRQFLMTGPIGHAHWRLLAPPWQDIRPDAINHWPLANGHLRFGLICHGAGRPEIEDLATTVNERLRWLGARSQRSTVRQITSQVVALPPCPLNVQHAHTGLSTGGHATSNRVEHPVQVEIDWLTPLQLFTQAQARAGFRDAPPSLLRIVRSLARRAKQLEPDWAQALGIGGGEWTLADLIRHEAQQEVADGLSLYRLPL